MEKKEYVTPSMRWRKIETSELLAGSTTENTNKAGEGDDGGDMGAKPNFSNNAWSEE